MTIEARRLSRGVGASLLALALILIAAVPIASADTIYPDNKITGTRFDYGLGSAGSEFSNELHRCSPLLGDIELGIPTDPVGLRSPHTGHSAGHRHAARIARAVQRTRPCPRRCSAAPSAPSVARPRRCRRCSSVPTGGAATFKVDRRFTVEALLPLGILDRQPVRFNYNFFLVDQADRRHARSSSTATRRTSTDNQTTRVHRARAHHDPMGAVMSGHSYRIEVTTTFRANPEILHASIAAV